MQQGRRGKIYCEFAVRRSKITCLGGGVSPKWYAFGDDIEARSKSQAKHDCETLTMKFWFVHSGEVSLQDQIVTQVSLGILSGDLGAGERLPSIRALAERFEIHPSIVTASYHQLARERWVEFRRGSGVFVRDNPPREIAGIRPALHLDRLIANLIQAARASEVSDADLFARIQGHFRSGPPAKLLLVESDVELRRIVLAELTEALNLPPEIKIGYTSLPRVGDTKAIEELAAMLPGSLPLVLPSKAEALREVLPMGVAMQILRVRSIPTLAAPWLPAPTDSLVGVASRWPPFLAFVRVMMIAAGFEPGMLLMRDASHPGWVSGLNQAKTVICDGCTATILPATIPRIKFNLLAEDSVAEVRKMMGASLPAARRGEPGQYGGVRPVRVAARQSGQQSSAA